MYRYHGSLVKERGPRGRWKAQDVGAIPFITLHDTFAEVVFHISHPLYNHPLPVPLSGLQSRFGTRYSTVTIQELLVSVGNYTLPTWGEFPSPEVTYATFADARQAGFTVEPVNPDANIEGYQPKVDLRDLRLTKDDVDYKQMFEECLITVNGLFHRTNYVTDALDVHCGARTGFCANKTQVGIYHLGKLGKITTVPMHVKRVHAGGQGQPLAEMVYLEIDERAGDLTGKSVLVSIGGYLHYPDGKLLRRQGERTYVLELKDYELPRRYFEMRELLGTRAFDKHLSKSTVNPSQVSVKELYSDETLRCIFALPQSFFVLVDTPELYLDKEAVEANQLPGSFISYELPQYPLVVGVGRFQEYWTRRELDRYVLSIDDGTRPNYLYETTAWREQNAIDDSRIPSNLMDYESAYFWKLGCHR